MEEFSEENLSNFSIFSSSNNTNERFPWLQEEEINTLRSRNEISNTAKSTKTWLNVFNEWKLQRNEARRFKDIPPEELDALLCRFSGAFYLTTISKPKGQVWFSRQRMGEHKIGQLLKDMAVKSGLTAATGKKMTNHLSRKTCVQKLKNAGILRDKIIDVTGHCNILSLNSYEGDDENQARELSNIISGCKQTSDIQQQPADSSPNKDRLPLQASSSSNSFSTINNFTGTVNFYGAFPGFPSLSKMPEPTHQSTEP